MSGYLLTHPFLRWFPVWKRNVRVWRSLIGPALAGNIGEPLLYLFGLGYGLGVFVGEVDGLDYVTFLASGIICSSAVNTASFEGMYSAYTRMAVQYTWTGMLTTPLAVKDIILGEIIWAGTKSLFSATAILVVASAMGLVTGWQALGVLPVALLMGMCFGALALIVTSVARGYDFFLYYFTLVVTPMLLLSGVFFPLGQMPPYIQTGAHLLPLAHAVEIVRPLMTGREISALSGHLAVILIYLLAAVPVAIFMIRRRLMD